MPLTDWFLTVYNLFFLLVKLQSEENHCIEVDKWFTYNIT